MEIVKRTEKEELTKLEESKADCELIYDVQLQVELIAIITPLLPSPSPTSFNSQVFHQSFPQLLPSDYDLDLASVITPDQDFALVRR